MDKTVALELQNQHLVGRNPREMTQDELRSLGHEPMSPLAALRRRCLDCCAGSPPEVRMCVAVACPAWPFRLGSSPWRAPPSEAKVELGRRLAARMHASTIDAGSRLASDAADRSPGRGVAGTIRAEKNPQQTED